MRVIVAAMISAVPAALLHAQTFVVDASGAAGSHFTSIAAAVAAVPGGAVLDVRPGTYGRFTITGRSLTVVGGAGVRVYDFGWPTVVIDSIPAGDTVVLRGLDIASVSLTAAIRCTNSSGAIVIDGCRSDASTSPIGGQLLVAACGCVHVRDSVFDSTGLLWSALELDGSAVSVTSSTFAARFDVPVTASNSRLDVTASSIRAGSSAPTVALHQSHLDVRGACTLTASFGSGAIVDGSGSVDVDPGATLVNAPAQPFGSGLTVAMIAQPWTTVTPGSPGGNATGSLSGPPGFGILLAGAPRAATAVAGLSHPSWLAPGTEVVLALGALPLSGGYAVPNAPWVQGVALAWQGAALGPGGLLASNPVACGHY